MEQQLIQEFSENSFTLDDEDTAHQCASLCVSFGLKPAELVASWEVFYLNSMLNDGRVQSTHLDKFCQFLQNEQKEAFRRKKNDLHFYSKNDIDMLLDDDNDEKEDQLQRTPKAGIATKRLSMLANSIKSPIDVDALLVAPKTPGSGVNLSTPGKDYRLEGSPLTPFSQRSNRFTVQFVLNKHLPEIYLDGTSQSAPDDVLKRLQPISSSYVKVLGSWLEPGCRFMYDRIENRFDYLEKRIKRFADVLEDHEPSNVRNHVAVASQERAFVVGMVCCDGEGHLNDKSVLLQGSVEFSGGHRVRLDLNSLAQFSLFPGQVIGVEGHNPSGHCFVASRVVDSIPINTYDMMVDNKSPSPKRQAVHSDLQVLPNDIGLQPISMVIAAGPYTTSDNLEFEPLKELLAFSRRKRPNALILMGPFIDSEHPQIKLGGVDKSFNEIFDEEIRTRIEEYCEDLGSTARVVLIPSIRDTHHDFVFPQPPFDAHGFEDPDRQISFLGNPGLFRLNELTIGCCTVDVLRHLSSEEISRFPASVSSERLARLATHIIGQRSFYPLFPAASGVPLDLSLSLETLDILCQPDILILPSDLAPFVKTLPSACGDLAGINQNGESDIKRSNETTCNRSICVNPGRLAKGINGGTFTDVFMHPLSQAVNGEKQGIVNRARISIMRI